jgi:glycerol-3-phosphate O-acyltransferase
VSGNAEQVAPAPIPMITQRTPPVPSEPGTPVVLLVEASGAVERSVVEDWRRSVRADGDGLEVVPASEPGLADRLDPADDPLIVPVRVAWLPRERRGERRTRWSDLMTLTNPHRPRPREQARIVRRDPDRCRVVVGEPAHVTELHERWLSRTREPADESTFAGYVARQAALALDRAERSVIGNRYKAPRFVAEELAESRELHDEIARLAEELGESEAEVHERVETYLSEVTATQSRLWIDVWTILSRPWWANAWTVRVEDDRLDSLLELNREYALVFLPTHRSYADSFLLDSILHEHGFPRNHLIGGKNMAFWPVGPIMRRTGVVFIRRSFRDDEVYKLAVRAFMRYLVDRRFNLEWYIENGRSRTGKLRPPSYGLLRYLIDATDEGRSRDAYLVPVSITYDQLAEVGAMAAEELGQPKRPEGLLWYARFLHGQRRHLGTAIVRFGEPFSLREGLGSAANGDRRLRMQKVAFEVCDRINKATPIMITAPVALALLGVNDRALTLGEIRRVLDPILEYIDRRHIPAIGLEPLRRDGGLRATLARLAQAGVVDNYARGTEPVFRINPGQYQVAAFYRNSAIHWLLNRAIVELVALDVRADNDADTRAQVWDAALRLRDLLKYEFFFPEKAAFRDELIAELDLLDPEWQSRGGSPREAAELLAASGFLVAHRVLRPFLESYCVVADRLAARDPRQALEKKAFLDECGAVARQYVLQRRLRNPESVSREVFGHAFELAANRDLIDPGREELMARRRRFAEEIATVLGWTSTIEGLDPTNLAQQPLA